MQGNIPRQHIQVCNVRTTPTYAYKVKMAAERKKCFVSVLTIHKNWMQRYYEQRQNCPLTLYRQIYLSVIRELKKGLCIHANTSGSDSPTDPKLGSFSRNRMPLPGHSWLLRNCLSTSVRRRKSGSYPAVFSETSERKGHAYIPEPPTPELGVFSAKTTPKVSSRPHPKGHRVLKSRKK